MARKCELTGKAVLTGNNRSHAMNKSRRRYLPNIQSASLWSDALQQSFKLRLSTGALRTVDRHGGLDAYLLSTGDAVLSRNVVRLKRRVEKARAPA